MGNFHKIKILPGSFRKNYFLKFIELQVRGNISYRMVPRANSHDNIKSSIGVINADTSSSSLNTT